MYNNENQIFTNVYQNWDRLLVRTVDPKTNQRFTKIVTAYPFEACLKAQEGGEIDAVSLYKDPLQKFKFNDLRTFNEFKKTCKENNVPVYGQTSVVHQYIAKEFGYDVEDIHFTRDNFKIFNFDIEVESSQGFPDVQKAEQEIISISYQVFGEPVHTLGLKQPTKPLQLKGTFQYCKSEKELLIRFIKAWRTISPDIVTGWYIEGFDIPYLVHRITKVLNESCANELSPFSKNCKKVIKPYPLKNKNGLITGQTYEIVGITTLDYLTLYEKFSPEKRDSYKLGDVAEIEIGERKVGYSQFGDSLSRFYNEDYEGFLYYNETDVTLVEKIDNKLQFMTLAITISQMTKSNLKETLKTTRIWDNMVYFRLLSKGVEIPPSKWDYNDPSLDGGDFDLVGAYVKPPLSGLFKWVFSDDVTSLYPSLIITFNLSPECLIKPRNEGFNIDDIWKDYDISEYTSQGHVVTVNGAVFKTSEIGIIPEMMEYVFNKRKAYKKQYQQFGKEALKALDEGRLEDAKALQEKEARFNGFQLVMKVIANGGYGAISCAYFRYYNPSIAEAITTMGQYANQLVAKRANEYLNQRFGTVDQDYVLMMDTDSIYVSIDKFVEELKVFNPDITIDEIVNAIDKFTATDFAEIPKQAYADITKWRGCVKNVLEMKREGIFQSMFIRSAKNYIGAILDNEGTRYTKPKYKVIGTEIRKSSTPAEARDKLKEGVVYILNNDLKGLQTMVKQFAKDYDSLPLSKISQAMKVSDLEKWDTKTGFVSGTPAHVKASMTHNRFKNKLNLAELEPIKSSEKVRYVPLKMPNPAKAETIAFIGDRLPPAFKLDGYVDRSAMFDKTFIKPMESFTSLVKGWSLFPKVTRQNLLD